MVRLGEGPAGQAIGARLMARREGAEAYEWRGVLEDLNGCWSEDRRQPLHVQAAALVPSC